MSYSVNQLLESIGKPDPGGEKRTRHGYAVLRVSTDSQDEQSQRRDIELACERNKMVITRWHEEKEKANEARPQFRQFMDAAKADPQCEFVIARDASRIFRDASRIDALEEELARDGVRLIADCRHVDWQDKLSVGNIWMKTVLRAQGEAYSAQVRDWTLKSMRHICQQRDPESGWCYKLGGPPLFGYRSQKVRTDQRDRKSVIVEREIWVLDERDWPNSSKTWELVRTVWLDWYRREGVGLDTIAKRLTQLGVRSYRGRPISTSTVNQWKAPTSLLTYTGFYVWNKHENKQLGRKVQQTLKPPHEWLWVKEAHPPILTLDEIERIEACVAQRAHTRKRRKASPTAEKARSYALSGGLAKCGACGANVVGMGNWERNGKRYSYYLCGSHNYRGGADCGPRFTLCAGELEREILRTAVSRLPVSCREAGAWAKKINSIICQQRGDGTADRAVVEREIQGIDTEIGHIVEAIKRGSVLSDQLGAEAAMLKQRREELNRKLLTSPDATPVEIQADDVLRLYYRLEEGVTMDDATHRRGIIREVVDSITLNPFERSVKVEFNLTGSFTNNMVAPTGFEPVSPD